MKSHSISIGNAIPLTWQKAMYLHAKKQDYVSLRWSCHKTRKILTAMKFKQNYFCIIQFSIDGRTAAFITTITPFLAQKNMLLSTKLILNRKRNRLAEILNKNTIFNFD